MGSDTVGSDMVGLYVVGLDMVGTDAVGSDLTLVKMESGSGVKQAALSELAGRL